MLKWSDIFVLAAQVFTVRFKIGGILFFFFDYEDNLHGVFEWAVPSCAYGKTNNDIRGEFTLVSGVGLSIIDLCAKTFSPLEN